MHKLSHLRDGQWVAHSFRPSYTLPEESAHTQCLRSAVPSGDSVVFERLVATLQAPYILLYVLHTPRGEGEPGRYQSPELSRNELDAFISQFGAYLSADARFDLWAYSPKEQATVVWDRHNQLFAYGPLARIFHQGRARVGGDAVRRQGVTTLRARARKEEQRGQRAAAPLNRVRSARYELDWVLEAKKLSIHAVLRDIGERPGEICGLERFVSELRVLGFEEGEVEVPVPHQHHYRPECDALAKALLGAQPWSFSPLRPEDEQ